MRRNWLELGHVDSADLIELLPYTESCDVAVKVGRNHTIKSYKLAYNDYGLDRGRISERWVRKSAAT